MGEFPQRLRAATNWFRSLTQRSADTEGYQLDLVEEPPFLVPEITVICIRRRLIPLLVGLLPQLGKVIDVRVDEQSLKPPFPVLRSYEADEVERPLLASALWEHEEFLSTTSAVSLSLKRPRPCHPEEIRLLPPHMLLLYGIPSAEDVLAEHHRLKRCSDVMRLGQEEEEPPVVHDIQEKIAAFVRQIHAERTD